jgi:alpha-galactosidase
MTTLSSGGPDGVGIYHFQAAGTSLVIDASGPTAPVVVHWGAPLGEILPEDLATAAAMSIPVPVATTVDVPVRVGVLPLPSDGWFGTPGLEGHRNGRAFSPRLALVSSHVDQVSGTGGAFHADLRDYEAELEVAITIELTVAGLVRTAISVRNASTEHPYSVAAVRPLLPVPGYVDELLDFTGRHLRERSPQRSEFVVGTHMRDARRGRPGLDGTLVVCAGRKGFGWRSGEVWGVHVAWSGNATTLAERSSLGAGLLGGGELLLPGEILLSPGESYVAPALFGSYSSSGLDALAARFHEHLRSVPGRARSVRPVVANTWEAVYFDHDLAKLEELADRAAEVGAERFVLDDGWFKGRRTDNAGLGDWQVDETVWPTGLGPIVEKARSHGMQFGLWVEPEMVNVDSEVARLHPEWVLGPEGRLPLESRRQQVLNLAIPEAFSHVANQIDDLVTRYRIDYLKWDHNRDLLEAGHSSTGKAAVRDQTFAAYRLMDLLRQRHPGLEIESCASGGGRVDLEVLAHTDRIWTSDSIDSLERQQIQRWTGLLVPPELMGAHVGAPTAHTSGRRHGLDFRAGTALFGHFGIEWDLTEAAPTELQRLAEWIETYKRFRPLLHGGTTVHADVPDPAYQVHGVVAPNREEALYAFVATATTIAPGVGRVGLPGLNPARRYRMEQVMPDLERAEGSPSWLASLPTTSGSALELIGLEAPRLLPESLALLHVHAID